MTQVNNDSNFVTGPGSCQPNDPVAFADSSGKRLKVGLGGSGDVVGPQSSTGGDIVVFADNSGKAIFDSGATLGPSVDVVIQGQSGPQTLRFIQGILKEIF